MWKSYHSNNELKIVNVGISSTAIMELKDPGGPSCGRGESKASALESATGNAFFSWKIYTLDWHICGKNNKIIVEKRNVVTFGHRTYWGWRTQRWCIFIFNIGPRNNQNGTP